MTGIKLGKRIWCDDECGRGTRGYRGFEEHYLEFFGRPFEEKDAILEVDGGDAFLYLMQHGIGVVQSFDGFYIYIMCQKTENEERL